MTLSKQIAKHVRYIFFGKNWTNSNIKKKLEGVDWKQATNFGQIVLIKNLFWKEMFSKLLTR